MKEKPPRPSRQQIKQGKRIKALREAKGLTMEQAAVAMRPHTTSRTWSKWERGEDPQLSNFRSLCRFFGVSGDYLLGNTNDPRPRTDGDDVSARAAEQTSAVDYLGGAGEARGASPRPKRAPRRSARRPES